MGLKNSQDDGQQKTNHTFTGRTRTVNAGCVELVSTDEYVIVKKVKRLLHDKKYYKKSSES